MCVCVCVSLFKNYRKAVVGHKRMHIYSHIQRSYVQCIQRERKSQDSAYQISLGNSMMQHHAIGCPFFVSACMCVHIFMFWVMVLWSSTVDSTDVYEFKMRMYILYHTKKRTETTIDAHTIQMQSYSTEYVRMFVHFVQS